MKNLLFPHCLKRVGWLLFIPAIAMAVLMYFGIVALSGLPETVVNDAVIIGVAVGALLIVCSKEAREDEMTKAIRLAALLNSLYVYVVLLVTSTLLVNGIAFMQFALINLVLLPIIYVVIFRLEMRRYHRLTEDEE